MTKRKTTGKRQEESAPVPQEIQASPIIVNVPTVTEVEIEQGDPFIAEVLKTSFVGAMANYFQGKPKPEPFHVENVFHHGGHRYACSGELAEMDDENKCWINGAECRRIVPLSEWKGNFWMDARHDGKYSYEGLKVTVMNDPDLYVLGPASLVIKWIEPWQEPEPKEKPKRAKKEPVPQDEAPKQVPDDEAERYAANIATLAPNQSMREFTLPGEYEAWLKDNPDVRIDGIDRVPKSSAIKVTYHRQPTETTQGKPTETPKPEKSKRTRKPREIRADFPEGDPIPRDKEIVDNFPTGLPKMVLPELKPADVDSFQMNDDDSTIWVDKMKLTGKQIDDLDHHINEKRCPHPFSDHQWSEVRKKYLCLSCDCGADPAHLHGPKKTVNSTVGHDPSHGGNL